MPLFLACKFSAEMSADYLMWVLSYVPSSFPLVAFKILSLSSIFAILVMSIVYLFELILFGNFWPGWLFPFPS